MTTNLTGTVIAITGHRPDKLGNDYDFTSPLMHNIFKRLHSILLENRPDYLITGMALGIDEMWARLAILNRIPFIAAIPFTNQDSKWPEKRKQEYRALLARAHEVVNVSGKDDYKPEYMQLRNEWMVNHCTHLVAVWDGSPGGTANCFRYASKHLKPSQITRINPMMIGNYELHFKPGMK